MRSDDPTDPATAASVDAIGETVGATASDTDAGAGAPSGGARAALPSYTLGRTLGVGGMGEVVLAHDGRIGREIAVKRLRTAAPSAAALERFLREARIQARLEHPAIVPVYELGHDRAGQPYFTMKRLAGVTLADQLAAPRPPPLRPLLRAFVDVCHALDFAHARGVVHRDLKPANIMLGDFGEVYVLDWGVARVAAAPGDDGAGDERDGIAPAGDITTLEGMTQAGAVLGTPGYMPPEQLQGAAAVTAAADVYALGAILFELLAGEPLLARGPEVVRQTLAGVDGSPAARRPERAIAPELDAAAAAALAYDPAKRPTARALADAIERYLDGDRDLERRRALAAAELAAAREASAAGDAGRAEAIRAAGRALALDPESREAAALITRLMLEPPAVDPPALAARLAASDRAAHRRQGRAAIASLATVLVFLAAAAINGLADAGVLAVTAGWTVLVACGAAILASRASRAPEMFALVVANAVLAGLLSRLFGSLIITPVVTCVMAVSLTSYPQLISHARGVLAILAASWVAPVALELAGVLGRTWEVRDGAVVSTSGVVQLGGTTTTVLLIGGNVLGILVMGLFANTLARARRDAQRRVESQAWHLRNLLPA